MIRMRMLTRRALAGLAGAVLLACPALAQSRISIVSTANINATPAMVAVQNGIFAKHGLDASITLIALMPNLPAALVSGSGQFGLVAAATFIQAVDGGLDLVAIAGGNETSHAINESALLIPADASYAKPADLVGRIVGVPGIGAPQHVFFRWWLLQKGVDPAKVRFVETAIPSMTDTLRTHAVDAVIAPEPAESQIVNAGVGKVAVAISEETPEGKPWLIYVATREWASAHRAEVAAFRAAMAEAQAFTMANTDDGKKAFSKYVNLPPAALAKLSLGLQKPDLTAEGLGWWVEMMQQQQMLPGKVDAGALVFR